MDQLEENLFAKKMGWLGLKRLAGLCYSPGCQDGLDPSNQPKLMNPCDLSQIHLAPKHLGMGPSSHLVLEGGFIGLEGLVTFTASHT